MEQLFMEIVNRGLAASLLVLVVVLLRTCFKRMPKWVRLVLWCFVAFRLLCPVSLETSFSLMPDVEKISRTVEEYARRDEPETSSIPNIVGTTVDDAVGATIENLPGTVQDVLPKEDSRPVNNNTDNASNIVPDSALSIPVTSTEESIGNEINVEVPKQQTTWSLSVKVWLVGMLLMAFYGVVSYLKVRRQIRASINVQENIYYCDDIDTPFVFGLFKPGIYLPSGMEEATQAYVLCHEKEHLRRGDQWWKILGFGLLSVYWFHPLLWVAYVLFCKDIEFACDERVMKGFSEDNRREYAQALLSCSIGKRVVLLCPTAFGENGVKGRIRSVMSYKKVTVPILIVALAVCLVVGVLFLTDRMDRYHIDSGNITLEGVELAEDVAENIAEDIAELLGAAWEGVYEPDNFTFTFYELESAQEETIFRVAVEADRILVREPEDSPVIAGMKKAQAKLTYEAERTYAQTMIDSMLTQIKQEAKLRICEPAIFVTVDELGRYELTYGDAGRTPLKEYFVKEDTEQEEFLGYLTVYQTANINPPMDVTGNYGYRYSKALANPENMVNSYSISSNSVSAYVKDTLYYKESVYEEFASYLAKDKEKLPWELLGEEISVAYTNKGNYWSERDALLTCTGTGTLYRVKGYEDSYRVAIVFEQNQRTDAYSEQQLLTTGIRLPIIFQSAIGEAKEEEIQPGKTTYHMIVLEHMNDLWFHEGREIFQQRMHLENAVSVNGLSMDEELLWQFLAEINDAAFVPITTRGPLEYETITFVDALGMKHSLQLNEEGYVKVQACETTLTVKIDEEISSAVLCRVAEYKAQQPLVSFENVFPVEKVFAKEDEYKAVYEELLERAELLLFDKDIPTAWFGEDGYYISKVPLYRYNVAGGRLTEGANLLYLSKDFSRSDAAWVGWDYYEEPDVSSGSFEHSILEMMKEKPSKEYILLYQEVTVSSLPGLYVIDESNTVCWSSAFSTQGKIMVGTKVEDTLYQKLYSEELAISYEELTARENLIWISLDGGVADLLPTPTPTPTPVDIANRMYQSEYEKSPYAAYSAEEWLKSGRLEVPFVWEDALNAQLMSERYAMYYIPQEALCQATTVDLARVAAFDYRFGAFGNYPSDYLEIARSEFNAFDALFAREDMVEALLKVYEANGFYLTSVATTTETKKEASRQEEGIVMLEILLATDEAFDKMNGQQEKVLQAVRYKMKQRETGLYDCDKMLSGFFAYIKENAVLGSRWYDYIMKNHADDKTLQYYLENVCYPGTPIVMDSRLPEDVYVPTRTPEPAVTEDTVIHTLNLPLPGKECRIDVIGKEQEETRNWGAGELRIYIEEELLQTILVQEAIAADGVDGIDKGYTECPYPNLTAALRDVNFDGYPDIEVWGWCPNNSIPYYYWCWNPGTKQFEYAFTLQLTDVDEERKHLISYQKVGGGVYYTERYRVTKDNELELAERMTEEYWTNTYESWREAYLHAIENFPDNMIDPYGFRSGSDWTNPEKYVYLGIHDFTTDGIPELIIGDAASLAVFIYKDGRVEKCIDLTMECCWQCIDGVAFHDNALLVSCYGSDGSGHTAAAYRNGAWTTAVYCAYHPKKCTINGEAATYEEFCNVVPFEPKDWEGTIKPHGRKKVQLPLDESFDFNFIRWIEN